MLRFPDFQPSLTTDLTQPGVTASYKLAANGILVGPDVARPWPVTLGTTTKGIRVNKL